MTDQTPSPLPESYFHDDSGSVRFWVRTDAGVVVGASMGLGPVIDFSDSMIFAMALANIVGLYVLMPVVKRELKHYRAGIQSGRITTTS